ncbi:MAG: hypothetical protein B6I20_03995, partial [Bacteroidetes bacterium 4572_117]
MKNIIGIILLVFIFSFNINAQTGPGGVGNQAGTSSQPHNEIWFNASLLGLSDTDPVTEWTDISGNNNDGTQGTSANQPIYRTGQLNGLPTVIFDGTDDFIPFDGSVLAGKDYTVIFVGQRGTNGLNSVGIGGTNTGQNNNLHLYWTSSQFRAEHNSNNLRTDMVTTGGPAYDGGTAQGSFGIFTTRLASTESDPFRKNYQNNHYIPDADGNFNNSSQLNSWNGAALSRAIFGATEYYGNVDIAEVIIYSTAINEAQLEIVHNYLSEKYNITIDNDRYTAAAGYTYDVSGIGNLNNDKHSRSSSAGLYLYEDNATFDNGEFVFFSHNNATNDVASIQTGSNVTNCGAEAAWNRNWYFAQNGVTSVDTKFIFDFTEALTGGQYPQTPANYVLLYKATAGADYSVVTVGAQGLEAADQIYFDVANANLNDGYYTIGTNDQTNSPVQGVSARTWYALISGDWDNWEVWTLDPSGNLPDNPAHELPSDHSSDKVVIHSGKTVTIPAAYAKITNSSLTVEGRLDFTTNTTIHYFGIIRGNGRILLAADNFPDGDASHFYTKGQSEGTVYYYGSSYNLSTDRQFYNVVVDLDVSTNIITQLADYQINGDLTITSGAWQINDATDDVIRNLTVKENVLVETNGKITVGTGNTFLTRDYDINSGVADKMPEDFSIDYHDIYHQFEVHGNFTNNGTVRLTNQTAPDYDDFTTTGGVTLRFKGAANKLMLLNSTTDLYNLVIDRGTDKTYIQTINSSNINNFVLYGANSVGRTNAGGYATANPQVRKALWIYNGTLKLTGSINIPTLSEGNHDGGNGDYTIGANASLWIAGSSVTVYSTASATSQVPVGADGVRLNSSKAMTVYGKFRITDGFFGTRNSAGFIFWSSADAQVYIEGGEVDVAQVRGANASGVASYVQSGGLLRARGNIDGNQTGQYLGTYPLFGLEGTNAVFQMSGGEILLRDYDSDSDPEFSIESAEGNYLVTGGKLTIDIEEGSAGGSNPDNLQILSTANLWDLEIKSNDGTNITVELLSDLKVSHDLILNDNTELNVEDPITAGTYHDVSIGEDFNIIEGATYTYGQNTTTFDGTEDGELYIGHAQNDDYEQYFWNLTVNKTVGKQITVIGDTEKDPDNVASEHFNRLVHVVNDCNITSGILNQGRQSIRVFAGV